MKTKISYGVAIVLIAIAPVSFLIVDGTGGGIYGGIALAGFIVALMNRHRLTELRKKPLLLLGLCFLLLYLTLPVFSYLIIDHSHFAKSRIQRQLLLTGIPFFFFVFWWLRPHLRALFAIIAINASIFGIYSFWYLWMYSDRVRGSTHAIHFGNVGLFLAFGSLALFPLANRMACRFLSISGWVLGCSASLLSGSKGGWIAVPFLLLTALALAIRTIQLKRSIVIGLIGLAILVGWGLFHTKIVQNRIYEFRYDLSQLEKLDPSNSVEVRLLMWGQAWLEIRQAPLLGTGFSGYRERVHAAIQSGDLPDYMLRFATEPHNEYLYQWVTRGGIGLIIYLSLLAGGGWHCFKWLFFGSPSQALVGYTGLCLVIVVAVGGLTITVIDQRAVIRFLGWISAVLIYCVWLCREKNLSEDMK